MKREKPAAPERLEITHGLCLFLQSATRQGRWPPMDAELDAVLQVLFPLACAPPDWQFPVTARTFAELMRCFGCLIKSYASEVVGFLLRQLETREPKVWGRSSCTVGLTVWLWLPGP